LDVLDLIAGSKTVNGITLGGGSAQTLIPRMLDYYRKGQFPYDRQVQYCPLSRAVRDSGAGRIIEPCGWRETIPGRTYPLACLELSGQRRLGLSGTLNRAMCRSGSPSSFFALLRPLTLLRYGVG